MSAPSLLPTHAHYHGCLLVADATGASSYAATRSIAHDVPGNTQGTHAQPL